MNLTKLYETQKILRDRINYNEPDRFNKLILALLVELGECANEWRGFKFWSKDQEPRLRKKIKCEECYGTGNLYWDSNYVDTEKQYKKCPECVGGTRYKNPLLEEYVDKLHFVLELGLEIQFDYEDFENIYNFGAIKADDITTQYIKISQLITDYWEDTTEFLFIELFERFIGLGEMLGFTWEQVEQAYFEKNKINHQRQSEGY